MTEYITDDDFDGTLDEVRDHYRRVRGVLDELATLGESFPTLAFAGNAGWYVTKDESDVDALEAGWTGRARCRTLEKDLREIITEQIGATGRDREVFNISSWKDPDAPYQEHRYRNTDEGKEWEDDEKPTPGYDELRGFGFWCDLDLADKAGRQDLSSEELKTIEAAQKRVIEAVADVYGVDDSAVYALDSGGGSYIYGPPEVALPINEELSAEEQRLFFDDMAARMREDFLGPYLEDVIAEIDGAEDLLDPDWMQNKNRQTKAPGSIHHNHDLVVTPLRRRDPETGAVDGDVDYTPTLVSELTEDDIVSLEAWARGLTTIEHTDAVETFVPNLYPNLAAEFEDWSEIVDARIETLRSERDERAALANDRREKIDEWAEEQGMTDEYNRPEGADGREYSETELRTETGIYEGSEIVTEKAELEAATETIDIRDVVRNHACDEWDTSSRSHETTFDPSWRSSGSGKSCAIPKGENRLIDNKCDAGAGPVKAYALGHDDLDVSSVTDDLGRIYGEVLDAMRADGYNIPVLVQGADDEHDKTPFSAVKRGAVAMGVLSADEFVERTTDDGQTYLGFPDKGTYNQALEALESEGIDHGREKFASSSPGESENTGEVTAMTSPTEPAGELVAKDGCYGYWTRKKIDDEWRDVFEQATNFLLKTLEFVETDDTEEIRIEVRPAHPHEEPYEVTVAATVFNESRTFREQVVIGRTTTFTNIHGDALNDIRKTVGAQDAPTRTGVAHVGAATPELDEYVTPEGVLTADGWADDPEHKYYAQASSDSGDASIVGEKWAVSDTLTEYDDDEVREALKLLPQSRLPGRAIATLGWFYSTAAKPLIHDHEGEFTHLQVRGKTESGKTSFLEVCAEAFGMKPSPWSASGTAFSLEQLHVGSRGAPVWIDEYKPSDMHSRNTDRLHRFLRMATRESVRTKGRPDQSFMKFRLQSPVVLSGEQRVGEPAVRRRTVQVTLSARAPEKIEHLSAYSRLAGEPYKGNDGETNIPDAVDLQHHALAYYKFLLSRDADELRRVWTAAQKTATKLLDEVGLSLRGSELQGAQTVVFGYSLYHKFANELDLSDSARPEEDSLKRALEHIARNVGADGQRQEHGDEFLELVSQAANAGYVLNPSEVEEADATASYRVYDPDTTPNECLAIHMPTVYPAVKRYARDYNVESEYNLLARNDYQDEFSDIAEAPNTHVAETSVRTRINGSRKRCVHLDPYAVEDRLGGVFDLSAFGINPDSEDESEDVGEYENEKEDSGPHAVRIVSLQDAAEEKTGYPNVKGEIVEVERPNNENAPALKATLVDDTTAIDVVHWSDPHAVREGDQVVIENAGTSMFNDSTQIVIRPKVSTVHWLKRVVNSEGGNNNHDGDANQSAITDTTADESPTAAAADGGTGAADEPDAPNDAQGPRANVATVKRALADEDVRERDDAVTAATVAGWVEDLAPDEVAHALEKGKNRTPAKFYYDSDEDKFWLTGN